MFVISAWLYLFARYESVNLEIISIVGWIVIWEAESLLLSEQQILSRKKGIWKRASV